jgi:hypothetical protein
MKLTGFDIQEIIDEGKAFTIVAGKSTKCTTLL